MGPPGGGAPIPGIGIGISGTHKLLKASPAWEGKGGQPSHAEEAELLPALTTLVTLGAHGSLHLLTGERAIPE